MVLLKIFVFLFTVGATVGFQPLVVIPGVGRVAGTIGSTAWSKRPIIQFYGIKYAESPNGPNRFQPPVKAHPWGHVYDASKPGPACPSFKNMAEDPGRDVEDCLTLTIHTPALTGRFPVMFYIHGEFFFDGSSEEAQPNYLLEKDVVLVSVQYRLAPFGFLSTRSAEIPGNMAALDVIMALEWVKTNIPFFGGNGDEITIFGQGSGATLAHLLMITPVIEQPIFRRVILQSGSMLSPYFISENPFDHAMDIAYKANCTRVNTVEGVNNCLVRLPASKLIEAFGEHAKSKEKDGIGRYGGFQWTVDDFYGVLPMHPARLVRDTNRFYYPMIGGVTKNVGSYFFTRQILKRLHQPNHIKVDVEDILEIVLKHTIGDDDFGIWKTLAAENLFDVEQIENSTLAALEAGLIDLLSNILYKGPILQAVQMNSKLLPNDTYLYTFDYKGQYSRYPNQGTRHYGVSLSDDNLYLFPYPPEAARLNPEDTEMAQTMVDLWTSFAITGVPESDEVDDWPSVAMITGPYLSIGEDDIVRFDFTEEMTRTNQDLQSYD